MNGIAPGIMHVAHDLMKRVGGTGIELSSNDLTIVSDPDQSHPAVSIGKRDNRLLQLNPTDPGLELDVLSLFGELSIEVIQPDRRRQLRPLRVKHGI